MCFTRIVLNSPRNALKYAITLPKRKLRLTYVTCTHQSATHLPHDILPLSDRIFVWLEQQPIPHCTKFAPTALNYVLDTNALFPNDD